MTSNEYILITGASGGLASSVISLVKDKYHIIATDLVINNNADYFSFPCDITKDDDINKLYNFVLSKTSKLYAIINLAGIFKMDSVTEGDIDKLKKVMEVNFYGTYRINQKFIPILDKGSKIINCTSELASFSAIPFNGFYTLSKVTLSNYSDTLRRELNYLGIKVVKVEAGSFKTNLLNKPSGDYDALVNNTKYYKKELGKLKKMMDGELNKTHDPIIFAKVIKKILNKKNPKICYHVKRSVKLRIMNMLPNKVQDNIYKNVIK